MNPRDRARHENQVYTLALIVAAFALVTLAVLLVFASGQTWKETPAHTTTAQIKVYRVKAIWIIPSQPRYDPYTTAFHTVE